MKHIEYLVNSSIIGEKVKDSKLILGVNLLLLYHHSVSPCTSNCCIIHVLYNLDIKQYELLFFPKDFPSISIGAHLVCEIE